MYFLGRLERNRDAFDSRDKGKAKKLDKAEFAGLLKVKTFCSYAQKEQSSSTFLFTFSHTDFLYC